MLVETKSKSLWESREMLAEVVHVRTNELLGIKIFFEFNHWLGSVANNLLAFLICRKINCTDTTKVEIRAV